MATKMSAFWTRFKMIEADTISLFTEMMDIDPTFKRTISCDVDLTMSKDSAALGLAAGVPEFVNLALPNATKGFKTSIFFNARGDRPITMPNKIFVGFSSNDSTFSASDFGEGDLLAAPASTERNFISWIPSTVGHLRAMAADVVRRLTFDVASPLAGLCGNRSLCATTALAKSTRIRHRVASLVEVARRGCCTHMQWPHFSINVGKL